MFHTDNTLKLCRIPLHILFIVTYTYPFLWAYVDTWPHSDLLYVCVFLCFVLDVSVYSKGSECWYVLLCYVCFVMGPTKSVCIVRPYRSILLLIFQSGKGHDSLPLYFCRICGYVTESASQLVLHSATACLHSNASSCHVCSLCQRWDFDSFSQLSTHMDMCGKNPSVQSKAGIFAYDQMSTVSLRSGIGNVCPIGALATINTQQTNIFASISRQTASVPMRFISQSGNAGLSFIYQPISVPVTISCQPISVSSTICGQAINVPVTIGRQPIIAPVTFGLKPIKVPRIIDRQPIRDLVPYSSRTMSVFSQCCTVRWKQSSAPDGSVNSKTGTAPLSAAYNALYPTVSNTTLHLGVIPSSRSVTLASAFLARSGIKAHSSLAECPRNQNVPNTSSLVGYIRHINRQSCAGMFVSKSNMLFIRRPIASLSNRNAVFGVSRSSINVECGDSLSEPHVSRDAGGSDGSECNGGGGDGRLYVCVGSRNYGRSAESDVCNVGKLAVKEANRCSKFTNTYQNGEVDCNFVTTVGRLITTAASQDVIPSATIVDCTCEGSTDINSVISTDEIQERCSFVFYVFCIECVIIMPIIYLLV